MRAEERKDNCPRNSDIGGNGIGLPEKFYEVLRHEDNVRQARRIASISACAVMSDFVLTASIPSARMFPSRTIIEPVGVSPFWRANFASSMHCRM